jgi:predicted Zn-dependent protease
VYDNYLKQKQIEWKEIAKQKKRKEKKRKEKKKEKRKRKKVIFSPGWYNQPGLEVAALGLSLEALLVPVGISNRD